MVSHILDSETTDNARPLGFRYIVFASAGGQMAIKLDERLLSWAMQF